MRGSLLPVAVLGAALACAANPDPTPCEPGAAPVWIAEGESFSVTVACLAQDRGDDAAEETFAMSSLPAGAIFDAATATLTWTPDLDQAAVWNLEIAVESTGEIGAVVIGVADAFDSPGNVAVVDPEAYPLEFGVPVVFIEPGPSQSDVDEPITVIYRGRTIRGRGEIRGASSLSYPKNSYLLKFENDAQFYDLDLDFVGKRRVVLTSTFDDNSYFRQRLAFELWQALEPSLPIRSYSVVVYIGGEYWGLYTITDHPSKHWLEGLGLDGTANLYKAINHDANFRDTDLGGDPKQTLHQGYEKKEGLPLEGQAGAFDDLDELVDFVVTSSDVEFAADIGDRVVLADFHKWWALVVFILAEDSAGKNSYHFHDQGPFQVAPWDFNASFGQAFETSRLAVDDVSIYRNRNEIFRRILDDPAMGPAMRQLLRDAIISGPFSAAELDARVDAIRGEIDAVATRDQRLWGRAYLEHPRWNARTDFNDYGGEVDYVRDWIADRRAQVLDAIAE